LVGWLVDWLLVMSMSLCRDNDPIGYDSLLDIVGHTPCHYTDTEVPLSSRHLTSHNLCQDKSE